MNSAVIVRDTLLFIAQKEKLLQEKSKNEDRESLLLDIKMLRALVGHIADGDPLLCKACEGQQKSLSCSFCQSTGVVWPPE